MLCHHTGTRAPVPTTMRDTGGMLKIFKLVYSVVRRARSLSLTKESLKKITRKHRQTDMDAPCKGCYLQKLLVKRKACPAQCGGSRDQVRQATALVKQADGKGASAAKVLSQCHSQGLDQPGGRRHGAGRPRRGRHDLPVVRLGCNFTGGLTKGAKDHPSQLTYSFDF